MVQLLKLENGYVFSSHTLLDYLSYFLSMLCSKSIHFRIRATEASR